LRLHQEFFSYNDYIQNKYEMLRDVACKGMSVQEAIKVYGFRSRYCYYFYLKQFKQRGFIGLFDLRFNKGISKYLNELLQQEAPIENSRVKKTYSCNATKLYEDSVTHITFSERRETAFFGLHGGQEKICQIVTAMNECLGIRSISRIFGIDKNTVLNYLEAVAGQCRKVSDYYLQGLHVEECQIDELWSFVRKKKKSLTAAEKWTKTIGDVWIMIAFDARNKILPEYQMGRRTAGNTRLLLKNFKTRTDGHVPFFTSDEFRHFPEAILSAYGKKENNRLVAPKELKYAVVRKCRRKGRVIAIKLKVIFGSKRAVSGILKKSPVSNTINISFVERSNLTRRHYNRRLCRKTICFSKKFENHYYQFEVERALYHFCRPHRGLKRKISGGKYTFITPMMAAGKTDHVWSVEELLRFNPTASVRN
jgi:IS1 family transposase